jgi:hypothetical protein
MPNSKYKNFWKEEKEAGGLQVKFVGTVTAFLPGWQVPTF